MLHTKFQGHLSIGYDEDDFLGFLPYMSVAAVLSFDQDRLNKVSFTRSLEIIYEIRLLIYFCK